MRPVDVLHLPDCVCVVELSTPSLQYMLYYYEEEELNPFDRCDHSLCAYTGCTTFRFMYIYKSYLIGNSANSPSSLIVLLLKYIKYESRQNHKTNRQLPIQ